MISQTGIREQWDNEAISDIRDSFGQEWTYAERKELERACQSTYFVAVVMSQMVNSIICKTRYNSIFHVGKNLLLFTYLSHLNLSILYVNVKYIMYLLWKNYNSR